MAFVRTTGGLLQLQAKKLTTADFSRAADFARDVLKKPELSARIIKAQSKHGPKQPAQPVPTQGRRADAQAPVLDDMDAFAPELFR